MKSNTLTRLNNIFWRNKAVWLLALTFWAYLNIPAILQHSDQYKTFMLSVYGVLISMVLMPIVILIFYIFCLLLNILAKVPLIVSCHKYHASFNSNEIMIESNGVNQIIKTNAIRKAITKSNYIMLYVTGVVTPIIIFKNEIYNEQFIDIGEHIRNKNIETTSLLFPLLILVYIFTFWVVWEIYLKGLF